MPVTLPYHQPPCCCRHRATTTQTKPSLGVFTHMLLLDCCLRSSEWLRVRGRGQEDLVIYIPSIAIQLGSSSPGAARSTNTPKVQAGNPSELTPLCWHCRETAWHQPFHHDCIHPCISSTLLFGHQARPLRTNKNVSSPTDPSPDLKHSQILPPCISSSPARSK